MRYYGRYRHFKKWRWAACALAMAFLFPLVAILAGCAGQYAGVPRSTVLNYQSRPTYGHLYDLATAYAEGINDALLADTMHPGMYAEYGVALALMGHDGEANLMLNAEAAAFPQSRLLVRRLKERLLPSLVDDTIAPNRLTVDVDKLQRWAYDSVTALQALPAIAAVVDSTDTVRIREQNPVDSIPYQIRLTANQKRELLAEQQARDEKRRQFVADSIAAAKQAAIDAKKQEQLDRQNAKKAQQEARQQAQEQRKQEAKEKEKQRKQQAEEKEQQRKQVAKEKEQQRKQEAKEKEQQRKQEAKEKEQQRKQEAKEKEQQRKQQAEEKEQQRKQQAEEKEQQRKQQAEEKEQQRKQQAEEKEQQRKQQAEEKEQQRKQQAEEKERQRKQQALEKEQQRKQQAEEKERQRQQQQQQGKEKEQ